MSPAPDRPGAASTGDGVDGPLSSDNGVVPYRRCGRSGLVLPAISLGLWHNFGSVDPYDEARAMILRAFELGITHFDLANNYGPEPGTAESTFGRVLAADLVGHRDEIVIATKAGYRMWPGPYGDGGSRKHLLASLDASLRRLDVEYVDIFYHHRPDPDTPLEESMLALAQAVRQGKALYAGISGYGAEHTRRALAILRELDTPCVVHQFRYNLLDRAPEDALLDTLADEGVGGVAFSPLAQGLLTSRYIEGIPADSRAAKPHGFLKRERVEATIARIHDLHRIAEDAGRPLAALALAWTLRHPAMTAAVIGASRTAQIEEAVGALEYPPLSDDVVAAVETASG